MRKLICALSVLFCSLAYAEQPTIALVLSGGGAKAGAQIGVLKAIDELGIDIDFISGTSMGAVVGGLYASGYSSSQIEQLATGAPWEEILTNEIDRDHLYYRRKRDDDIFFIQKFIGFKEGSIQFPLGIVQGQRLYQAFKRFTIHQEPLNSFDDLPIRFRAVTTDLTRGGQVIIDSGDLALAMFASMAVPGVFSPVEYEDTYLVDGGSVANLPVAIAKDSGTDMVIVVDVGSPKTPKEKIKSAADVLDQMVNIQIHDNTGDSLELLSSQDVIIQPNLKGISTADFDRLIETIQSGYESGRAALKHLGTSKPNRTGTIPYKQIDVDDLIIGGKTGLHPKVIEHYLPSVGDTINELDFDVSIKRLYGLRLFESITYGLDEHGIYVNPRDKRWGPRFIQAALRTASDFDGNSSFLLGLGVTNVMINRLAGELRFVGFIGDSPGIIGEWYQPLTTDLAWFIAPNFRYERAPVSFFVDHSEVARLRRESFTSQFAFGRNFNEWGRIEVGYRHVAGSERALIGIPPFEENFKQGALFVAFEIDTLDNSFFPHNGTLLETRYLWNRNSLGGDNTFDQFTATWVQAFSNQNKKHNFLISGNYDSTTKGVAPFESQFNLGGLFRLSGLAEDQLSGQQAALMSMLYYYELAKFELIPNVNFPIYAGASYEIGNAWQDDTNLFNHSFKNSGSLFIGLETPIGPIYLGYGVTEDSKKALQLFMGKPFK